MTMKNLKLFVLTLAALLLPVLSLGQTPTALTTTTLTSTIGGTSGANSQTAPQNCFGLASVTNIVGQSSGSTGVGSTGSGLYVDRELMQVITVNTTAKTVCVIRGMGGSQASSHTTGKTVWIGIMSAFANYDPEGNCASPNNWPYTPFINQRTSAQWLCGVTDWVPGFGNPGISGTPPGLTAAVASATTILPSGPLFTVTGTTAIATITAPAGIQDGESITIKFSGVDTWTAAGNIAVLGTNTTAGTYVTFTWNATTSKWSPSRVV